MNKKHKNVKKPKLKLNVELLFEAKKENGLK